jgi:hypothetical protein
MSMMLRETPHDCIGNPTRQLSPMQEQAALLLAQGRRQREVGQK